MTSSFKVPRSGPRVALDGVKLFGMRMADEIEPEQIVEPDRVDNQRVASPNARPSARTRWDSDQRDACAVHENLPVAVDVAFKQEINVGRSLDDLPRIGRLPRARLWAGNWLPDRPSTGASS